MLRPMFGSVQQIAGQPGPGKCSSLVVVEAGFDQHAAGADRLGIFGDERPLLRRAATR